MELNYRALPATDSEDSSADERRLKEMARAFITYINLINSQHRARLHEHGKIMGDTIALGNTCTEMVSMLSKQESQLQGKVDEVAIFVTKNAELKDKIAKLENQISSSRSTLKSQRDTIDALNSDSATTFAHLLEANNKIKEHVLQIEHFELQITFLENTIDLNNQIRSDMEDQLSTLHKELQSLQTNMTNLKRKLEKNNEVESPGNVADFDDYRSNKSPRTTNTTDDASWLFDSSCESTAVASEESDVPEESVSEEEKESEDDTPSFGQELPPTSTEAEQPNVDKSTVEAVDIN